MPFDVCLPAVAEASVGLRRDYPGLEVKAVVGDFHEHVRFLPRGLDGGPVLIAFLGSTIGNFDEGERERFFAALRLVLRPGDWFLLGADLVKAKKRLDAAYNDAAGVTVLFNKNVLRVLNRDLRASFDEDLFDHVAAYDRERELVDIRLRARAAHDVKVRGLGLTVHFAEGEEMRTEISTKFRRAGLERSLRQAGFSRARWWTDRARDFSLSLWRAQEPDRSTVGAPARAMRFCGLAVRYPHAREARSGLRVAGLVDRRPGPGGGGRRGLGEPETQTRHDGR
jgi:L-histidine N-alpha-methyltransferase